MQSVYPSEEGTAKSRKRRGMDHRAGWAKFGCAVLQGTKLLNYCPRFVGAGITVVDEEVLGTGGWMLIFHLLDNFG